MNHKEIIELEEQGKILIGIDRPMARKFYTDIPISEIKLKTDETPYFKKMFVWFAFLVAPISLIASIIFSIMVLKWWGIISLIVFPFAYLSYSSTSSRGNSTLKGISIFFITLIVLHFGGFSPNSQITLILTIFLFSLWSIRLLYCSSTLFLRNFLLEMKKLMNI